MRITACGSLAALSHVLGNGEWIACAFCVCAARTKQNAAAIGCGVDGLIWLRGPETTEDSLRVALGAGLLIWRADYVTCFAGDPLGCAVNLQLGIADDPATVFL
jgi:hypothetical protein